MLEEIKIIESDISSGQASRIKDSLNKFLEWLKEDLTIDQIDQNMIERYQRSRLQQGKAASTVDKDLHALCRMLKRNGYPIQKPSRKPGSEHPNRHFTQEELNKFFQACEDTILKTLFSLLLCTGARVAEIVPSDRSQHLALLKEEINLKEGTVSIRTAKQKKTGSRLPDIRIVPIPQQLTELVKEQMDRVEGPHLFDPFPHTVYLARRFNRIIKAAGIPKYDLRGLKFTAHSFRHTYATLQCAHVGSNPYVLRAILGHRQISTTSRYCHASSVGTVVDLPGTEETQETQLSEGTE